MTEAMVIGGDRRIVYDGGDYLIQSRGKYSNSPKWSTIIVLTPTQLGNIIDFIEELEK